MNEKKIKFKFLEKLKKIKNIEYIIVAIFIIILLGIYFISFDDSNSKKNNTLDYTEQFTSYSQYTKDLENRLTKVLSKIEGLGEVNVMITLESSPELIIAYNTEEKTVTTQNGANTNETVTIVKDPIIINVNGENKALILMEQLPKIKGIIIVAKGAKDVKLKLDILNATSTIFDISVNSIQIFAGE